MSFVDICPHSHALICQNIQLIKFCFCLHIKESNTTAVVSVCFHIVSSHINWYHLYPSTLLTTFNTNGLSGLPKEEGCGAA